MTEAITKPSITAAPAPEDTSSQRTKVTRSQVIAEGFHTRTKGERLFNRLTYMGVGYFGVTGVSVFLTWLLRDSTGISPHFEKFTKDVEAAIKKIPRIGESVSQFVYSNMTIMTLFLGGSIASVVPVKLLENNKAKLVKRFDEHLYGKDVVANSPEIQQAHAQMEAMPKQTWGSVGLSRLLSFATTLGTFVLMGSEKSPVGKAFGHSIDDVSVKLGRNIDSGLHTNNPAAQEAIANAREANAKWFKQGAVMRESVKDGVLTGKGADRIPSRIFSYIGLDGIYTVVTSSTLYFFTRVLAPVLGKKQKTDSVAAPIAAAQPVVQPEATSAQEHAPQHAPHPHVTQTTHHSRVAQAPAQEITA